MANDKNQASEKDNQKAVDAAEKAAVDPFVALADSGTAATGEQVVVPKTPKEIAEEGTKLSIAGDFSTGGNLDANLGRDAGSASAPVFSRVWSMDADQTVANRDKADTFKPDCSVRVA